MVAAETGGLRCSGISQDYCQADEIGHQMSDSRKEMIDAADAV